MDKIFEQELLRQLSLINFDRSIPLLEQKELKSWEKSDRLGNQGEFQPLKPLKPVTKKKLTGEQIYKGLKSEIDAWVTTDDDRLYAYVTNISKENYPQLLKLVMDNEKHISVMDWIMTEYYSVNEDNTSNREPELFSAGGVERSLDYYTNDRSVLNISAILKQFNNLNTGEGDYDTRYSGEVDLGSDGMNGTASNEQLSEIAHIVLPIAAIVTSLFTGGISGVLMGGLIELGDAAIYEFVDHDHYGAGLALIFAIAGPLDEILGPLVKKYGKTILAKLLKKKVLSEAEQTTIRYISRNEVRLTRLTYLGLARQLIKRYILRISDASKLVKFIFWLTKKGYLTAKFTSKFGLTVGGSFLTWDAIAAKLGICNSVQLSALKSTDYKILQLIGTAGEYVQPYTKGCKTDRGEKIFKEMEKTLLTNNQRIVSVLESLIKTNTVFTTDYSKYNMYEVTLLQYVLYNLGFSYTIPNQQKVDKEVQKGVKFTKEKCLAMMTGGIDIYKMSQHPECDQYLKPNKPLSKNTETLLKSKPLNTNTKYDYGKNIPFKWGYYDKQTEDMVKEFQKKYGLLSDGDAGRNTFTKMLSIVKGLGEKQIPNYNKLNWSPKEIESLRKKVEEELKADSLKMGENENSNVTKEQVEQSIKEQKDSIVNSLEKANNSITFNDDDLKMIKVEAQTDKP